jgi:hypothetical protein
VADNTPAATPNRAERIIAFMIAGLVLASVLSIAALLIGTALGAGADNGFSQGLWPLVIVIPLPGLSIGMILMVVLLVMTARKRSRAARDAGN